MTELKETDESPRPVFPVERLVGPAPSPWPAFVEFHRQHEGFDPHPEDDRANRLYAFWLAGKAEGERLRKRGTGRPVSIGIYEAGIGCRPDCRGDL